jgi:hypothetical protein
MTDIKDFILQLEDTTLSLEEQQAALAMIEQTLIENKQIQEKTLEENSNLIVDAVKEVEKKLENRFIALTTDPTLKGAKGDKGDNGKDGTDGKPGINGRDGKDGTNGVDGKDGEDGEEAPKIVDAEIAIDDTLLLTLSDGSQIKTTKPVVGERGSNGSNGVRGDKGDAGIGIAIGGTTGQVLTKVSSTNYDTTWTTPGRPRVLASTANSATPTLNTDDYDMMVITGQSVAITSFTTNLTGTPVNGQKLWISITGTGAIAITWGASFESSTVTLPSTTVTTNRLDIGFIYNVANSDWRCVAVA